MRRTHYHISLNLLIPLIFVGISVLAILGTYHITKDSLESHSDPIPPLWLWGSALGLVTFGCGAAISRFILQPVKKFVREAEQQLEALPPSDPEAPRRSSVGDDIGYYSQVFDQVTQILSKVEASTLFPNIIGQSKAMRGVFSQLLKVAATNSTVLITGESGTGKELVAAGLYGHSQRKEKPFIKMNCMAIPEGLIESELFGHEKGAFTGAATQKRGKFELANTGTLFLDEIGDMPLSIQGKILRALQEREIERVGGTKPIRVDVRIIAATNKDLLKCVKDGLFREDLFHRLNVLTIHLPPLRHRTEDIPLLAEHFLKLAPEPLSLSQAALNLLISYSWPGNVRELQNVLERASVLAEGELIEPFNLPLEIMSRLSEKPLFPQASLNLSLDEQLGEIEKTMILNALRKSGGVQNRAAEILGINPRSLWHRIKKYGIDKATLKDLRYL